MNLDLIAKIRHFFVANLRNSDAVTCDMRRELTHFDQQSLLPRLNQRLLA